MRKKSDRKDWFKLWARDFATSLDWQKMSLEERGAYVSLLFQSWIEWPDVSLPADKRTLRVVCNAEPGKKFDRILHTVLRKFETAEGRIFNARLRKQRDEIIEESEVRALSGAKGGAAKGKHQGSKCLADSKQMGPYKEVEVEREQERESDVTIPPSDSESGEITVSVRSAISRFAAVWQELKGKGDHVPKPDDRYGTLSRFKELCAQHDLDLLADAFRLWAIEMGTGDDRWPLNSFVKVADEYLRKVAPVKGYEEKKTDEAEQARIDEAIRKQRADLTRETAVPETEQEMNPEELFS